LPSHLPQDGQRPVSDNVFGWRSFGASVIGKGHIDTGLPCQDAWAVVRGEHRLVAIVCDGAGSARQSERAAKEVTLTVSESLAAIGADDDPDIAAALESARLRLEVIAAEAGHELDDYACTVVGLLLSGTRGVLFHLGDGLAVARSPDAPPVVSLPENGEYSNETWFLSHRDWRAHLRVTPLPPPDQISCIALMSDGAMPFAMARGNADLFEPFIGPVLRFLAAADDQTGNEALAATLGSERTYSITEDDKTLVLLFPEKP